MFLFYLMLCIAEVWLSPVTALLGFWLHIDPLVVKQVVLGSKKTSWTFFRSETDGCAGQLLINGAIFLPSIRNVWWHLRTCSSNIWLSIQFFFCDLYRHGKFFMCLKQRVVLGLLIANISKFFSNCISRWHSGKVLLCYSFLQSIFDL